MGTKPIDQSTYRKRLAGVVSPAFHTKRVGIIGTGAGSYQVEKLARLDLDELRLADKDVVAVENLCRTAYDVADIGDPKVEALKCHVQAANPFIHVRTCPEDVTQLDEAQQTAFVEGLDLLIAGTDSFEAQALVNCWSQRWKIPAVWIGVHDGALGGRIVWSIPGETACYRCVTADRYEAFEAGGAELDLPGTRGAIVDVQFIDMIALKIAIAILDRGQESTMGRFFAHLNLARTEIIVRTSPEYEFGSLLWDVLLGDLPTHPEPYAQQLKEQALFAMDTVWLPTKRLSGCPDCGQPVERSAG